MSDRISGNRTGGPGHARLASPVVSGLRPGAEAAALSAVVRDPPPARRAPPARGPLGASSADLAPTRSDTGRGEPAAEAVDRLEALARRLRRGGPALLAAWRRSGNPLERAVAEALHRDG